MTITRTTAGKDHTVPEVLNRQAHGLYTAATAVTDYQVFDNRGHSLVFDHGWEHVADDTARWTGDHKTGLDTDAGAVSTVSHPSA